MYENGVQEGAAARPCYFSIVVHSLKFLSSDLWLTRRFSSLGLVDATFLTHITIASVYSQYYILRSQEGYMGDFTSKYSAHPQQVSPTGGSPIRENVAKIVMKSTVRARRSGLAARVGMDGF